MLLRDIVDLEATQGAGAPPPEAIVEGAEDAAAEPPENDDDSEEGESPGMSLSALEEKLKPEVLANFEEIEALYKKLSKVQSRRLDTMTAGEEINARSEKSYEKQREELVGRVEQVRLHNNRIEELVTQLKQLNQRLHALEGQLLRMGEHAKVPRDEFLKEYRGRELDPNWLERVAAAAGQAAGRVFAAKNFEAVADTRNKIGAVAQDCRPADRRVPPGLRDRQPRRAGQCARQEGDDRGEPAPGDLDRQEIHQSRAAVPGPDPGGQHRPDEGGR